MTKKILIGLLALGTLSFVPSAEARRGRKSSCHRPRKCAPKCKPCAAPKCTTEVQKETFFRPCRSMIEVTGQCPYERCTEVTTCTSESEKCIGPCEVSCENAVNPKDRGATNRQYYSNEEYEENE